MTSFPKVPTWMCALQIMDIATFYRGNMPVFFTMRYVYTLNCFIIIIVILNVHLKWCQFFPAFFRTPSIMSYSTTVSTAQQWTMFFIPVTFLRKPHRLHLVAWLPKSRALSVSPKSYILCVLEGEWLIVCLPPPFRNTSLMSNWYIF